MQDLLHPFLMACNTRQTKLVQISLQAIQRLVSSNAIDMVKFCDFEIVVLVAKPLYVKVKVDSVFFTA